MALGRFIPGVSVLALLLLGEVAHAQVQGLTLSWQAPQECPSQLEVEEAVKALLMGSTQARQVRADVSVKQDPDGTWRATLATDAPEGSGTRTLEGESCEAIASATAVVISLTLVPGSSAQEPPPPEPVPPPEPPPPPIPPALVEQEPTTIYLHALGGGVLRALPALAPYAGVGLGVRKERWDGELTFAFAPEQSVHLGDPIGAGANLWLYAGSAIGCYAPLLTTSTALQVCAGAHIERITAQSFGVSNPAEKTVNLVSPMAALRSRTALSSEVSFIVGVLALARPSHPHFVIGGVGQVSDIPVFAGMLTLGLERKFE